MGELSMHTHDNRVQPPTRRRALAWLAALGSGAALHAGPAAAKPPPLRPLLAVDLPPDAPIDPAPYLVSEKYDGVRALWNGSELRTRSGMMIAAPASFIARLPAEPLDGELWLSRGRFEAVSAAVRRLQPDAAEWRQISYMLFESPGAEGDFAQRAAHLQMLAKTTQWPQLQAAEQTRFATRAALHQRLEEVVRAGGEGLMLHRADAAYVAGRSDVLLKLKPLQDADAVVLAHLPGQGRHAGRLGALQVRSADGTVFAIGTGFSDAERTAPPPIGSVVTYTHRGHTRLGVPRFASFLRMRSDV
jgi:DNA ligase 1